MKRAMLLGQLVVACSLFIGSQAFAQVSYYAPKSQRGTTTAIAESVVASYCGDFDGCTIRLGMSNWDGAQRTASREFLFYYNAANRNWRASSDSEGTNYNSGTQHVYQAWSCYFTDGQYSGWSNQGDPNPDFGLLSWDQYNADCRLTILD
jgi:hypothetical protein